MRSLLLVVALLPACVRPNPAFDMNASVASAGTGTDATTLEPGVTGTGDPGGPTTGTGDPGGVTTGTGDPGGSTTGIGESSTGESSAGESSTGESSTGAPVDCWGLGAAGWPAEGVALDALLEDYQPVDPFLSPDGLTLVYLALKKRRPFRSVRAALGDPFPNGSQLALWVNNDSLTAGYPTLVLDGAEMLLSSNYDVYSATATPAMPDKFAAPQLLTGPNTPKEETVITATADGATLIVTRNDGPPIPPFFATSSFRFHQFTRANLEVGAPYVYDRDVTPLVAPLGVAACPTLSPDGLRLFFGSTDSAVLTMDNASDVVGVYYTSRADRSAPWATPEKIGIEHAGKGVTCPSSVTADGCQLAFHRSFPNVDDSYTMHLAVRAP